VVEGGKMKKGIKVKIGLVFAVIGFLGSGAMLTPFIIQIISQLPMAWEVKMAIFMPIGLLFSRNYSPRWSPRNFNSPQ